jgi:hypothetical protein
VDEPEAALAEMQFATGRRVFLSCTIAFALVCSAVIASVPIFGPSASGAGAAVLLLAALVFSLATSAYAAPGASVYVGMAGVVVGSLVPGIEGGGQFGASLFAFLFGSLGAYVGYRLEMAWFPVPNPVRQQHAGDAWALLLFATVIPAPYEMSRLELVTRAVIAALVVGWATLGLPYSRRRFLTASYSVDRDRSVTHRRRLHATPDSLMLLEAAWLFWRRQLSFRIVGILLAIPPLVGLMNSCAVAPRLTQHRTEISRDLLLVWSDPTGSEPTPERVYALPQDWWTRRRVSVASSSLPGHRVALARDTDAYRALDEYGVTIPAGLRDVADASGGSSPELWCEEKDKRESGAPPGPALVPPDGSISSSQYKWRCARPQPC